MRLEMFVRKVDDTAGPQYYRGASIIFKVSRWPAAGQGPRLTKWPAVIYYNEFWRC